MRFVRTIAAIIFLAGTSLSAQTNRPDVIPASKPIVLRAAHMFDGKNLTSPGLVVITDGKITAVGANVSVPADAEIIELGDATISPGFIDAHTHLTFDYTTDFRTTILTRLQMPLAEQALNASVNARTTLWAGFTTVRDMAAEELVDVGLRNAINKGKVPGPRMLVSAHALGATGGHCDNMSSGARQGLLPETDPSVGIVNGADEARRAVRIAHKYGADHIKVCATGGVLSLTDAVDTPQLTQAELNAIVDEAHALRMKTGAHAHGAEGAKRAIRAGIDSIEHGTFLDDEALQMMRARGTVLIPTLMAAQGLRERLQTPGAFPAVIEAKARAAIAALDATMKKAIAMGVKIGLGTDATVYPHGRNAEEFAQLERLGMKPLDALRAATTVDAELLGIADRVGSLEAGKIADIVAVPGDPTQDIHATEKVFFVMKDGKVFRNDRMK